MDITHKILVDKETGKCIFPAYLNDDPRPCPTDAVWIQILPGSWAYKHWCIDPPEDLSHLDLQEIYWDFDKEDWIEIPTSSLPSFQATKLNRNELLKQSDRVIVNITDSVELERWKKYRQELRDMFVNIPSDFDWNEIVFPRSPLDIDALKQKALEGNEEAIKIIARDKL